MRLVRRADNLTTFLISGSLSLLEPSGHVQACIGIATKKCIVCGAFRFIKEIIAD